MKKKQKNEILNQITTKERNYKKGKRAHKNLSEDNLIPSDNPCKIQFSLLSTREITFTTAKRITNKMNVNQRQQSNEIYKRKNLEC